MPRMTKPERTQLWLDRLSRYAASQLTVAEFCQREEISSPSFYHWKRRLTPRIEAVTKSPRSNQSPTNLAVAKKPGFTELVINSAPTTAAATLPGNITISLGTQPEIAALIVDRLLRHAANLAVNKAVNMGASC